MTVTLTQPAFGKQPGDTYTGTAKEEAWLLASGYADQDGYTGPGIAATGPADTTIANSREFDATRGQVAGDGGTPEGGTNTGPLKLHDADPAYVDPQGDAFGVEPTTPFTGYANDPAEFPTSLSGISRSDIPLAGVAGVKLFGTGLSDSTGVTVGGTAATAFTHQGDKQVTFTAPAKAAGTYDVVLQDPDGNKTLTGAVTYA